MITTDSNQFNGNDFALQIMAKGSFVDEIELRSGKTYIVEATTIRLNVAALDEWQRSTTNNCRDCYQDGAAGDLEWQNHKEEYRIRQETIREKIKATLGINPEKAVAITQIMSEVFTVVNIWEAKECRKETPCPATSV
jgi:hypothetical protein